MLNKNRGNKGETSLEIKSKKKKTAEKVGKLSARLIKKFFKEILFTEWYFGYNLSLKSSNKELFWECSNFSKFGCLKNTILRPMQYWADKHSAK